MGFRCVVCKHPDIDAINIALGEGASNKQVAGDFGLTVFAVDHHRASGHAGRALTAAVIQAGKSGVLSSFAKYEIAAKSHRIRKLQRIATKIERVIIQRSEAYKALPGGDTGLIGLKLKSIGSGPLAQMVEESFFDGELVKTYCAILEQAAKEAGEWRPDGGAKAEATNNLAHAIIVHAKGSLPPPRIEQADVIDVQLGGEEEANDH